MHLGSGNYAARSNMGMVANNRADADELMIGVDNYSENGDNNIRVSNSDFSGFEGVRIGSGNCAHGSNRIVVDLGSGSNSSGGWVVTNGNLDHQNRLRSWLQW